MGRSAVIRLGKRRRRRKEKELRRKNAIFVTNRIDTWICTVCSIVFVLESTD